MAHSMSPDETGAVLTMRRQVGGTFGYFTRIPASVDGVAVASVRMASPKAYQTIIMAGFRSQEDPTRFDAERVVNAMTERTVYDAAMHGDDTGHAFMIYRIDLKNWFPGNEDDPDLPLDQNGDGYLDGADSNWQLSEYLRDSGLNIERGAVYGSRYLIPTEMTADDVAAGLTTFEPATARQGGTHTETLARGTARCRTADHAAHRGDTGRGRQDREHDHSGLA